MCSTVLSVMSLEFITKVCTRQVGGHCWSNFVAPSEPRKLSAINSVCSVVISLSAWESGS